MNSYELEFMPSALNEWHKLDNSIKLQFHAKLKERLSNPRVQKDKLQAYKDVYKIKLRSIGYRLVYQVKDNERIILILVVGARANDEVYKKLKSIFGK
ncbi:MAG: type II toxin-antitoxin system RelE/ParE family toxin [Campylobacter sp.]|nr:type II toxin-antitoxin system RelE/ParE family toxin [Campylobacter sp.]